MYADLIFCANKNDKLNIGSFSEQIQGVLSPFYTDYSLSPWYGSIPSRGQIVTLLGKEMSPWVDSPPVRQRSEPQDLKGKSKRPADESIRLYAIEAKDNWMYPKGVQPEILAATGAQSNLSMKTV
jgi:hypothetical protein